MTNPNLNYDALPVSRPDTSDYAAVVEQVRADLARDGCAVIREVLTRRGVGGGGGRSRRRGPFAHRSFNRTNPYFTADDDSLPPGHPQRRFYDRSNAFIPADHFAPGGTLRGVYDEPGFDGFIRDCLQADPFHRYADPLADVIINMADAGPGFPCTSTPTTTPSPWPSRRPRRAARSSMRPTSARPTRRTSTRSPGCSTAPRIGW